MSQTQNLFPKDNTSKQTVASHLPQKSGVNENARRAEVEESVSLMISSGISNETVKYFDLVTEKSPSKSIKSKAFGNSGKRIFTGVNGNKKPGFAASQYSFPPLPPLSTVALDDSQELFTVLLDYLDRIIYIKELSKNLRKLDAAIETGKIEAVNLIARNCVGASAHCGMFKSIERLRFLERVRDERQLRDAAGLSKQIRREFERFRLNLKENLEQMAIDKQRRNLN